MTEERCDPPACVRPIGHADACRPNYWNHPICGAWLPSARTTCVRTRGHAGGKGGGHRSAWALEYDRARKAA